MVILNVLDSMNKILSLNKYSFCSFKYKHSCIQIIVLIKLKYLELETTVN